jgi:hypothetical protein
LFDQGIRAPKIPERDCPTLPNDPNPVAKRGEHLQDRNHKEGDENDKEKPDQKDRRD